MPVHLHQYLLIAQKMISKNTKFVARVGSSSPATTADARRHDIMASLPSQKNIQQHFHSQLLFFP
jgi:hypothetical protein